MVERGEQAGERGELSCAAPTELSGSLDWGGQEGEVGGDVELV